MKNGLVTQGDKDYLFHEYTLSLCHICLLPAPAKIILKKNKVYIQKICKTHGNFTELLEEDASFYLNQSLYAKPGTKSKVQTKTIKGCPYDCGLCPDHEQHTCIGLIEVTNFCNLKCPTCYASSGEGKFLSLKKIDKMMDFYQDSEFDNAELLQISGGEPTTHPQILEIIQMACDKKFKYIMLNTNGLRIAGDLKFVEKLSRFKKGFEIYLQFDGLEPNTYLYHRGRDLTKVKQIAIENLIKYKIPITFASTIEKGINDHEIGKIFEFALNTSYIRGVNFQPVAFFGRLRNIKNTNRITRTGIINSLEQQTNGIIKKSDFIPLPCHPERVAFSYLYKTKNGFIPITRKLNNIKYIDFIRNTFTFKPEDFSQKMLKNFSSTCDCLSLLKDIRPLIPIGYLLKSEEKKQEFINNKTFRVSVVSFVDAYNFDMKSMKKECVHIITPDLKKIPFSTFNLIHRQKYATA